MYLSGSSTEFVLSTYLHVQYSTKHSRTWQREGESFQSCVLDIWPMRMLYLWILMRSMSRSKQFFSAGPIASLEEHRWVRDSKHGLQIPTRKKWRASIKNQSKYCCVSDFIFHLTYFVHLKICAIERKASSHSSPTRYLWMKKKHIVTCSLTSPFLSTLQKI